MRLIMFDCDGTLVDSQHVIVECMQMAFRSRGLAPPAPDAVKRIVGLALPEAIHRLYPEGDPPAIGDLVAAYKECFMEVRARPDLHEPMFDGVIDILDHLEAAGYFLGVATGKSRRGLIATLEHHGLAKYFVTLQTVDDAPGKPHPGMLERAMADTGAERGETVLIGDTVFDMEMALNAGTGAFGVSWGYHDVDELHAAGAHLVLDRFDELPPQIARWRKED
ncbi:MAG: haloacid dehalogenase [Rhodospirillaceae bacterium]|nr:haloacid dehalogenase [Rhodospirillaceae bacterium]